MVRVSFVVCLCVFLFLLYQVLAPGAIFLSQTRQKLGIYFCARARIMGIGEKVLPISFVKSRNQVKAC